MDNNEKALVVASKLGLGELVAKQLSPTQIGWLSLEKKKRDTFEALQNGELVVQGKLNDIDKEVSHEKAKERLKDGKAALDELKQRRLEFTGKVTDMIITPAMEFEKRCAVLITNGTKKELELREAEEAKAKEANAGKLEEQAITAHITNEQFRLAAGYRNGLQRLLGYFYTQALEQGVKVTALKEYKKNVEAELRTLKVDKMTKIELKKVTAERAKELFAAVKKYDPAPDLELAINQIDQTFSMYAQDLKNAKAAIENKNREVAEAETNMNDSLKFETSTNNLLAKSTAQLEGAPTVKRTKEIEVVGSSNAWALIIINFFAHHFETLQPYVKVKSWDKLTVAQMAAAISAAYRDNRVPLLEGVGWKEVKK